MVGPPNNEKIDFLAPPLFTVVHRTVHQPQHLHGSSPSTLDARVPAIQRPSARSHRTVDNSLITSRIEYSTFLIKWQQLVRYLSRFCHY